MARLAVFDKLNNNLQKTTKRSVPPIVDFFEEMELPIEEIESRINLAYLLMPIFTYLFFVSGSMATEEAIDYAYLYDIVQRRYTDAIREYNEDLADDNRIKERIASISQEIVNTTIDNIQDGYYTSDDRARMIAENETNAIANYEREQKAIAKGATMKMWVSMRDERVRKDHIEVDGTMIPINDYFEVGDDLMLYPGDLNASPEETVGCRCVCQYF